MSAKALLSKGVLETVQPLVKMRGCNALLSQQLFVILSFPPSERGGERVSEWGFRGSRPLGEAKVLGPSYCQGEAALSASGFFTCPVLYIEKMVQRIEHAILVKKKKPNKQTDSCSNSERKKLNCSAVTFHPGSICKRMVRLRDVNIWISGTCKICNSAVPWQSPAEIVHSVEQLYS